MSLQTIGVYHDVTRKDDTDVLRWLRGVIVGSNLALCSV